MALVRAEGWELSAASVSREATESVCSSALSLSPTQVFQTQSETESPSHFPFQQSAAVRSPPERTKLSGISRESR